MDNYTLTRADSATHIKVIALSFLAGIIVVGVGFAIRPPVVAEEGFGPKSYKLGALEPIKETPAEQPAIR